MRAFSFAHVCIFLCVCVCEGEVGKGKRGDLSVVRELLLPHGLFADRAVRARYARALKCVDDAVPEAKKKGGEIF